MNRCEYCGQKNSAESFCQHCGAPSSLKEDFDKGVEQYAGLTIKNTKGRGLVNIRTGPGFDFARIGVLPVGTNVSAIEIQGGWVKLAPQEWVSERYVNVVETDMREKVQPL